MEWIEHPDETACRSPYVMLGVFCAELPFLGRTRVVRSRLESDPSASRPAVSRRRTAVHKTHLTSPQHRDSLRRMTTRWRRNSKTHVVFVNPLDEGPVCAAVLKPARRIRSVKHHEAMRSFVVVWLALDSERAAVQIGTTPPAIHLFRKWLQQRAMRTSDLGKKDHR